MPLAAANDRQTRAEMGASDRIVARGCLGRNRKQDKINIAPKDRR